MNRRECLSGLGAACSTWPMAAFGNSAWAQAPGRVYRLGHLANSADSELITREIVLPELARLGFQDGRNLVFDGRVGEPAAMPGLMRDLLAAKPDAIVAIGPALSHAGAATRSVPILTFGFDPVEIGLAASYARPGGNVTGVVILVGELEAKRLSILLEAAPGRRRIAALVSATRGGGYDAALRDVAAGLGVDLRVIAVTTPADYPAAFAAMRDQGALALLIGAAPEFSRDRQQLSDLALEAGLPSVCEWAQMAHAGCLIGYGPDRTRLRKRLASQVAQIFRGAMPGDIAIETPTVFEFAVNLGTAKQLGLDIPFAVRASADELIE